MPLPLDRAPYEPAPQAVLDFLFRALDGSTEVQQNAPVHAEPRSVVWLPLNRDVGLAHLGHSLFAVSLSESGACEGYRLSDTPHLSVTTRGPLTALELGAVALTVRTKVARAAVQLLGLSRLARVYPRGDYPTSHWHAPPDHWARAVHDAHVDRTELTLAFLPLPLTLPTTSRWLGDVEVPAFLLVTPQRLALTGAVLTGEVYMPANPLLSVSSEQNQPHTQLSGETVLPGSFRCVGKHEFQLNEHRFKTSGPLAALARCFDKQGDERVLSAAQTLCKTATSDADKRAALRFLEHATTTSVAAAAQLPRFCLARELDQTVTGQPPWMGESNAPDLVEVWETYGFEDRTGYWLLVELEHAPPSWRAAALELSDALWRKWREEASDRFEAARLDLTHARYAFNVGYPERARAVLTETPRLFPNLTLGDLNLPTFSGVSPWRDVRRDVELLLRNITDADPRQKDLARQRLIMLDPLNPEWLEEATQSNTLGRRAREALQLLQGPVSRDPTSTPPDVPRALLRALEDERIATQLSHPLTRGKQTVTGRLVDAIAIVPSPDESVLRLYCERVTKSDSPLLDALDRAATVLGLGHFELYLSRGKDDIGAQAFAAQSKLLLVGGQHTDPSSRHHLEPKELIFAFAAELAHVRFGHSRVSTPDVMRGLVSKSKQGAELAFNLLPLISGIKLGKRLGVVTAKLSLPRINKALTAARTLESAVNSALPPDRNHADLNRPTEALLATHRLEQLSADRAALTCCGDLIAAFRAMLKTRADYVRVNTTLDTNGALAAIEQHAPSNPEAFADLRLRLGSLVAFYVSDDYEELRRLTYR